MTQKYTKKELRRIYAKAATKLLCPKCEGKSLPQLLIEHRSSIPLLVKGTCEKCGYAGNLAELSLRFEVKQK